MKLPKVKTISLLIIATFFFVPIVSSQTLQDSLLIHYKFDGDSLDYSGNNYHPKLFRATFVDDKEGNPNSAIHFDGITDLIILPDTSTLKPYFPMSISFWLKMDTLIPQQNVFFTNDFYRFAHSGVWMNLSSNKRMALSYGDGFSFNQINRKSRITNRVLEKDIWYFVTGVIWDSYDMRIYIDGEEEMGYMEGDAYDLSYVGTGGNIGRKDANYQINPFFLKGYLDDFRYWNRRLSPEEIRDLFEETLSINEKEIVSLKIFPNPTKDKLKIELSNKINDFQVVIYNSFGSIEGSFSNTFEFDSSKLKRGIYFLKVIDNSNNHSFTKKFVKL